MTRIEPHRPVAGIDVGKASLDLYIDPDRTQRRFDNDAAGCTQLVQLLRDAKIALVLLEATGRYHRRLAADLLAADLPVTVVNPQRARAFARATGRLEKSDQIDPATLASFARAVEHRQLEKPRKNQHELAELVTRRRALVQVAVAEKNRLADTPCPFAQRQARKMLRLAEQQIEDLDRRIAKLIESDDDWDNNAKLLDSIPGVGPNSANQLVAELPELGKVDRGAIAKLVGVAPLCDQSGRSDAPRRIQGGRRDVRTTLFMVAFNVMQHNDRFQIYAQRLRERGKKHKVIVTAIMRKLLTIMNQMIKTQTPWDETLALNLT